MNRKEAAEKLQSKLAEVQGLIAKGSEITIDDLAAIKTGNAEIASLKATCEQFAALDGIVNDVKAAEAFSTKGNGFQFGANADQAEPASKNVLGYSAAGQTWMKKNADGSIDVESIGRGLFGDKTYEKLSTNDYKSAYMKYLLKGGERALDSMEYKALQEGIDDEGGYFVPPDYAMSLIQREPTPTSINPNVTKWQTRSDAKIFPKIPYSGATDDPNAVLYSTGVRVVYPGEIPAALTTIDTTEPGFGEFRVDVHTAMMAISITRNMLDDSPISVMSFIASKFQETDDLELDNRIINGTGVNQAAGILRTPTSSATDPNYLQYIPTKNASALTADQLKALLYGLAPQYLRKAKFAMGWQNTAQAIDLLKDGNGRYLWSEGQQDNNLSSSVLDRRLLGFPVLYSEFMPSVGANNYPIAFGDWAGYYLVERLGLSLQVLVETKAKQNQVEIIARRRFGGGVAEPYRLKLQKVAVS